MLTECNKTLLIVSAANSSQVIEVPQLSISLQDALWMPDGRIVCATNEEPTAVWRLTQDGNITAQTSSIAGKLSYSADDKVMYLADSVNGVYRSEDNGETLNLVLNMTGDMYHCEQVVRVFSDSELNTYDLWTVESSYVNEERNHTYKYKKFTPAASKAQQNPTSNHRRVTISDVRKEVANPTSNHGRVTISNIRKKLANPTYVTEIIKSSFRRGRLKHNIVLMLTEQWKVGLVLVVMPTVINSFSLLVLLACAYTQCTHTPTLYCRNVTLQYLIASD